MWRFSHVFLYTYLPKNTAHLHPSNDICLKKKNSNLQYMVSATFLSTNSYGYYVDTFVKYGTKIGWPQKWLSLSWISQKHDTGTSDLIWKQTRTNGCKKAKLFLKRAVEAHRAVRHWDSIFSWQSGFHRSLGSLFPHFVFHWKCAHTIFLFVPLHLLIVFFRLCFWYDDFWEFSAVGELE
jgi:hypothetical protein